MNSWHLNRQHEKLSGHSCDSCNLTPSLGFPWLFPNRKLRRQLTSSESETPIDQCQLCPHRTAFFSSPLYLLTVLWPTAVKPCPLQAAILGPPQKLTAACVLLELRGSINIHIPMEGEKNIKCIFKMFAISFFSPKELYWLYRQPAIAQKRKNKKGPSNWTTDLVCNSGSWEIWVDH